MMRAIIIAFLFVFLSGCREERNIVINRTKSYQVLNVGLSDNMTKEGVNIMYPIK